MHKSMQAYTDTLCTTQRESQSHHNHTKRYPHIWWTRLLKVGRLVHGHRDCHWHPNRKLHTSGWGQITQHLLHAHLQGHLNRKVLGWNQMHPEIETLQCEYPHLYLTIYGNTTKGQWNPSWLHPSLQNSSKAMCFWQWHCSNLHF